PPSQLCRQADSFGDAESDSLVARGGERSGIAGANPARVGDTPISSNESGLGVTFLFLLEAPVLTAFNPKKRCPFQFVPVIALATCERLRWTQPFQAYPSSRTMTR